MLLVHVDLNELLIVTKTHSKDAQVGVDRVPQVPSVLDYLIIGKID